MSERLGEHRAKRGADLTDESSSTAESVSGGYTVQQVADLMGDG